MFLTDAAWPNAAGAAISGEEPWKRGWGRRRLGMTEAPQTPCLRVEPSFTAVLGGPQSSVCFRRTLTTAEETDRGEASVGGKEIPCSALPLASSVLTLQTHLLNPARHWAGDRLTKLLTRTPAVSPLKTSRSPEEASERGSYFPDPGLGRQKTGLLAKD